MVYLKIALTFLMGFAIDETDISQFVIFIQISVLFSCFLKTAPASTLVLLHSLWLAGKAEGLLESQIKLALT